MKHIKKFNESNVRDIYNSDLQLKAWDFACRKFGDDVMDRLFPEDQKSPDDIRCNVEDELNRVKDLGPLNREEWLLFIKNVHENGI